MRLDMDIYEQIKAMMLKYGYEPLEKEDDLFSGLTKVYAFMEFMERKFLEGDKNGRTEHEQYKPVERQYVDIYPERTARERAAREQGKCSDVGNA